MWFHILNRKFRKTQSGSEVALPDPSGCVKDGEDVGWGQGQTPWIAAEIVLQPMTEIPAVAAQGPVAFLGVCLPAWPTWRRME